MGKISLASLGSVSAHGSYVRKAVTDFAAGSHGITGEDPGELLGFACDYREDADEEKIGFKQIPERLESETWGKDPSVAS